VGDGHRRPTRSKQFSCSVVCPRPVFGRNYSSAGNRGHRVTAPRRV